jgi:hypothetical protein
VEHRVPEPPEELTAPPPNRLLRQGRTTGRPVVQAADRGPGLHQITRDPQNCPQMYTSYIGVVRCPTGRVAQFALTRAWGWWRGCLSPPAGGQVSLCETKGDSQPQIPKGQALSGQTPMACWRKPVPPKGEQTMTRTALWGLDTADRGLCDTPLRGKRPAFVSARRPDRPREGSESIASRGRSARRGHTAQPRCPTSGVSPRRVPGRW